MMIAKLLILILIFSEHKAYALPSLEGNNKGHKTNREREKGNLTHLATQKFLGVYQYICLVCTGVELKIIGLKCTFQPGLRSFYEACYIYFGLNIWMPIPFASYQNTSGCNNVNGQAVIPTNHHLNLSFAVGVFF